MASILGTAVARAPRTSRTKAIQVLPKNSNSSRYQFHAGESTIPTFNNASEVIALLEAVVEYIHTAPLHKDIQATVVALCANLKAYGPQLESLYKDQLDRGFIHLRNAGRNEKIDLLSRLHLLEIVELRAGRWVPQEQTNLYYQRKLSEFEDSQNVETLQCNAPISASSPATIVSTGSIQSTTSSPPPATPPPLLQPGEVVKSSGKYTQATKIPGKNFFKDEVVIRNADSGKVMGIKGRRVHLIEEISDTVISFQRVNPGAKERLVQITGASEDNIEKARQLMEETIVRNASPVRSMESLTSIDQTSSGPERISAEDSGHKIQRSQSMVEAVLHEYRYTVNVGDQTIKITGSNLDLVRVAKLALDEYFSAMSDVRTRTASSSSSTDDGVVLSQDSPRSAATLPTSEAECKRTYKRDYLVLLSGSPLSQKSPLHWERLMEVAPEIMRKETNAFNGESYLKQYPERFSAEAIVVSASTSEN